MAALLDIPSRSPPPDDLLFEQIAVALETRGLFILPAGLPEPVAASLWHCLCGLQEDEFQRAGIGRGPDQSSNPFVRRNRIRWLEEGDGIAPEWFDWSGRLMAYLNRRLFLGLFSFESHIAIYQQGDFYRRHLDAFRGEANRVLSLVTYLNAGWQPDQGGELVIYPGADDGTAIKVVPAYGTLVLFLSEEFPHEVLPATRERYSVAGWFRVNNSTADRVDPPR